MKNKSPAVAGPPPVRVALVGLGPIGLEIGRAILDREGLALVAAVDRAPALMGQPLGKLLEGAPAVTVEGALSLALATRKVDVVALATGSRLRAVAGDIDIAIDAGSHVVSTCEELAAPGVDPVLWSRLDARAHDAGVSVLGTGVNPGFVMDRLVLQLAGACVSVRAVKVERIVDAAQRRGPLRKKVGEGLSVAEFKKGVKEGTLGHVGLRESATIIARGLGWKLDGYKETIEPVEGYDKKVLGLRQVGRATVDGVEKITLTLQMSVKAPFPHDRIQLDSDPPMDVNVAGGTHGDRGTIGTVVNALSRLKRAPRGLVTVGDLFA